VSPLCLIDLMNSEPTDVFRIKTTALKCGKNHKNWLTRFEDASRKCGPSNAVTPLFWPTLYSRYKRNVVANVYVGVYSVENNSVRAESYSLDCHGGAKAIYRCALDNITDYTQSCDIRY